MLWYVNRCSALSSHLKITSQNCSRVTALHVEKLWRVMVEAQTEGPPEFGHMQITFYLAECTLTNPHPMSPSHWANDLMRPWEAEWSFSTQCHNNITGMGLVWSHTLHSYQQMCNVLHLLNDGKMGPCEMDWPNEAWTSPCLSRQLGSRLAQPQRTLQYPLINQHLSCI